MRISKQRREPGRLALTAVAGLVAASASACPAAQPKIGDPNAPAAFVCAPDQLRTVDIDREVAAINAIQGAGDEPEDWEGNPALKRIPAYAPHLRALGLDAVAEAVSADPAVWGEVYTCTASVRPFELTRGSRDRLVSVDCQNHAFDYSGVEQFAASILRPLGAERECELGHFGSARHTSERPCLTEVPGDVPWAFERVELVRAGSFAVQLTTYGGHCDGIERGDTIMRELWGLEDGKLVAYADALIADTAYRSPCPPTTWLEGAFAFGASFPKTVTYTATNHCEAPMTEDCAQHEPCTPSVETKVLVYERGRYVEKGAPPAP
jgi:hypothetical protein